MLRITIAALTMTFAGAAAADQFRFVYTESDFSSPSAVEALHDRIQASARSYCNRQFLKTGHLSQVRVCVDDVVTALKEGIGENQRYAAALASTSRDS